QLWICHIEYCIVMLNFLNRAKYAFYLNNIDYHIQYHKPRDHSKSYLSILLRSLFSNKTFLNESHKRLLSTYVFTSFHEINKDSGHIVVLMYFRLLSKTTSVSLLNLL